MDEIKENMIYRPAAIGVMLDYTEKQVLDKCRKGELPGKLVGRKWLFKGSDLLVWYDTLPSPYFDKS